MTLGMLNSSFIASILFELLFSCLLVTNLDVQMLQLFFVQCDQHLEKKEREDFDNERKMFVNKFV